jgi:hypothetical protein
MMKSRRIRWAGHTARIWRRGMHIGYWWENHKERDHKKDQDVGGDNIKMDLREIGWGGIDWIDLPQDRDRWRALVNTVMNFQVP